MCGYYNVGYCKEKTPCQKYHSNEDCENMCTENNCFKRHRRPCKDKVNCKFLKSGSFEFIHKIYNEVEESKLNILVKENKELKKKLSGMMKI